MTQEALWTAIHSQGKKMAARVMASAFVVVVAASTCLAERQTIDIKNSCGKTVMYGKVYQHIFAQTRDPDGMAPLDFGPLKPGDTTKSGLGGKICAVRIEASYVNLGRAYKMEPLRCYGSESECCHDFDVRIVTHGFEGCHLTADKGYWHK